MRRAEHAPPRRREARCLRVDGSNPVVPGLSQHVWLGLCAAPLFVLLLWIAIGERGPRTLPLPYGVELPTVVAATTACVALSVALALSAWRQAFGLVVLGVVLIAIGVFWIALQGPPIAGPVLWSNGRHGIHANDWWGLVPIGAGLAAWLRVWRGRDCGSTAHSGTRASEHDER